MKKQLLVVLIGTALAAPMAAYAEGAYVGVNVGRSEQKLSIDTQGSAKDNATAYKLYGGYDVTKNFGVEAGYIDFGKASVVDSVGDTLSSKLTSFYVAATGTLPLSEQFSLFAKLGVSFNRTKADVQLSGVTSRLGSENRTTPLLGIGAAYNFSKNLALVAEYENFGKVIKEEGYNLKADLFSVGLRYKF